MLGCSISFSQQLQLLTSNKGVESISTITVKEVDGSFQEKVESIFEYNSDGLITKEQRGSYVKSYEHTDSVIIFRSTSDHCDSNTEYRLERKDSLIVLQI